MTYRDQNDEIFYRVTHTNNGDAASLFYATDGAPVTKLDIRNLYDVETWLGVAYGNPNGLRINVLDAQNLGIEKEQ